MKRLHGKNFGKPQINSGHVSPTKLEKQMYMKLGKLNKCNPDKITSNTHVQNPTQITAQYLYRKNFQDLSNEQKIAVYRFLTPVQTDSKGRPAVPSKGMS